MNTVNATVVNKENEVVIYGRITDFTGLNQATQVLVQEQYEIKPIHPGDKKGKIRVRREMTGGVETYTMTTKVDDGIAGLSSNKEYTIGIDREMFDAFKSIASSGMKKTRYVFPIKQTSETPVVPEGAQAPEVTDVTAPPIPEVQNLGNWEVDVFTSPDGTEYAYCKIDMEIDNLAEQNNVDIEKGEKLKVVAKVSELPIKLADFFVGAQATAEQNQLLDFLYQRVFTLKSI